MTNYDYSKDIEVKRRLEQYRCEYDLAGNRYTYIGPKDNLLISDADGFLIINSLPRLDQAMIMAGHPELTYEKLGPLMVNAKEAETQYLKYAIDFITAYMSDKKIAIVGLDEAKAGSLENILRETDEGAELLKKMQSARYYNEYKSWYDEATGDVTKFYIAKDRILEERDIMDDEKLNYDWVFDPKECIVDEKACKFIVDNVGKNEAYSKGLIASWVNSPREVIAKVKLLRPYLGNIPILSMPYHLQPYQEGVARVATDKVDLIVLIHGKFNEHLSSFHDDSLGACSNVRITHPKLIVVHKTPKMTACESLEKGKILILDRKRAA